MAEATTATEVAEGVKLIAIPTPFIVGRVNTYLFEGDPLTLLDTGPNSGTSLDELEQGLESAGFSIEDIGRVILSHQHVDHVGLAGIIQRRSGAEVMAIRALEAFLIDWKAAAERDDAVGGALMRQAGLSNQLLSAMASVSRAYRAFGGSVSLDSTLEAGSAITIGHRTFDIMHKPGHSPSDTVFHCRADGLLVSADHLLERVSSNPLVTAPLDPEADLAVRPRPLPTYLRNMSETRELDVSLVLPGHGDPFTDHREVIDARMKMHERRAAKLLASLSGQPKTAFELAEEMWGDVATSQAFLAISEVVGHMDLLIEEGSVTEHPPDARGVVRFASA